MVEAGKKTITFTLVEGAGQSFSVSSTQEKFFLGRAGGKNPIDGDKGKDLGADSACSRDTAILNYQQNTFTLKHIGSCLLAYVVRDKPFQLLDNFVIDIGGEFKYTFFSTQVQPASQIKDKPEIILSPLFILEGRTEGLQKGAQAHSTLQLVRI